MTVSIATLGPTILSWVMQDARNTPNFQLLLLLIVFIIGTICTGTDVV